MELVLDEAQRNAVYVLCYEPVGVITGGPGCGKTASLRFALPQMGKLVALCAPSGKAARRMAEVTGHPASTVHRLLGLNVDGVSCVFHAGNPLPYDVVVVDEASTLDNALCAKLLAACDVTRTRVHFIGDVDQLPSVGAGQVLEDIIDSNTIPVVRLTKMYRSAKESWVCRMAPEILAGRIDLSPADNFEFIEADEDLAEELVNVVEHYINKYGRDAVQVISPMNVGDHGTTALNPLLQERINPISRGTIRCFAGGKKAKIFEGDDVVVITNDYDRNVFNGETGRVLTVERGVDGNVIVDFVDRRVTYTKSQATEFLRLAYALTVHKMQGSEVDWVILALHETHGPLLSRKLLYTAVTRARIGVVLVGQRSAVMRAAATSDKVNRCTNLGERLVRLNHTSA